MDNDNDNNNNNSSSIKRTTNYHGVVMLTYVGKPVEIFQNDPESDPEEEEEDEDEDEMSVYGCSNICHSFGAAGTPCGRCGEDSSSYYVGDKLNQQQIEDAIRWMEEEDREEAEEAEEAETEEDSDDDSE